MKTKVVIFDFDGTLSSSDGSCSWARVWKALDDIETDKKFYHMFASGEIDDATWLKLIEERFRELNLRKSLCSSLANEIKLIPGINETFNLLNQNNVKIYILSGGVRNLIEIALAPFEKHITRIEGYQFVFNGENFLKIEKANEPFDDKHKYVDQIKKENDVSGNEILFVGNGANDQTVYLTGARTLCINPDDADYTNKKYWNNYIKNCKNLTEIIKFL